MKYDPIITVGRQYGSGGRYVAKLLAEKLNIPYYDKELLAEAAKDSGICRDVLEEYDEKNSRSLLFSLLSGSQPHAESGIMYMDMPLNHRIFLAQFDTIRRIADEGPCVIVGRCADYILRDRDDLLSVFIHAPLEFRVERARTAYQIDTDNIEAHVKKQDKTRANFYNRISDRKWGDANSFHFAMSSVYGIDFSAEVLKHAAMHFLAHKDENPEK